VAALRIERDGALLRVTIAKPERRNAFDAALIGELTSAFADAGDARAVLLAGDGPSFCAGADVEWQRASIDLTYDENVEDALRLYRMPETIDRCPAVISPFVLPRIGHHARRYFLSGERFDAETALRIGLVHELAEDLDAAVERVVGELLTSGPEATRAAKELVRERPAPEETARIAARLRSGKEGQEGLRAFLEKRTPSWR
jgi:methylglutaconyl-CoA hydratase